MKTRGDALLKTLPDERQAEIFARCQTQKYEQVLAWLRADGLRTSNRALSEFYSWYALRQSFRQAEHDTQTILDLLKQQLPDMPETKVAQLGNTLFNLEAIKRQDPKLFLAFQTARHKAEMDRLKLEQKERALLLDERRIKLLEAKAAQAEATEQVLRETLTPEEKQLKLKEIFGMS